MSKTKKPRAKYRNNDVVIHTEQKTLLLVQTKDWYPEKGGWLYTLKSVTNGNPEYKRYYEDKLSNTCDKVKNSTAIKVLYGNTKK